jgi:hypothetical protein
MLHAINLLELGSFMILFFGMGVGGGCGAVAILPCGTGDTDRAAGTGFSDFGCTQESLDKWKHAQ